MTAKASVPNVFAAQAGPIPLSQLDADFTSVIAAINENNTLANYYVDSGAANALHVTAASGQTFTAGIAGAWLDVLVAANNTGATTLQIGAGALIGVVDRLGNVLLNDALLVGAVYRLVFDGTSWRVLGIVNGNGSFVSSSSGFASGGNFNIIWQVTGFQVTIAIANGNSPSNADNFYLNNIPSYLQPPTTTQTAALTGAINGGVAVYDQISVTVVTAVPQWTVNFQGSTNWMTSGAKGFPDPLGYQTFCYLLI